MPLRTNNRALGKKRTVFETPDGERIRIPHLSARYLLLLVVALVSIGPFIWQLSTSLQGVPGNAYASPPVFIPEDPTLDNYKRAGEIVPIWRYAGNSLLVAAFNIGLTVVGTSLAGYALARLKFRGRKLAVGIFFGALLIPQEAALISLLQVVDAMNLTDTLIAVFLPTMMSALSVLLMWNAFRALPADVEQAAIIDGANVWQRFRLIALPSVKGTIGVVALLAFMGSWNDFLWPLVVLSDTDKYTLTVGLNYLQGTFAQNPTVVAAGTMIAVLPLIILFVIIQRGFFRGVGEGAVKG